MNISLTLFCLLSFNAFAGVRSIVPSRTVTPLLDIFSLKNKPLSEDTMAVMVSGYNRDGSVFKNDRQISVPMKTYETALKQSRAVYEMIPTYGSVAARMDKMVYAGTAFHIGENLVLTNMHVISRDKDISDKCGGFQLREHSASEFYPCKKVHYCNYDEDVCLVEMGPKKMCKNSFCTKYDLVEMKSGESLRLKEFTQAFTPKQLTDTMTAIGNTLGLGIHYSQGRGYSTGNGVIQFYAPLRSGNSGGPLIGEDGVVWGVVKAESEQKLATPKSRDSDVYNRAVAMERVVELMRQNVKDQAILDAFNSSVDP